MNAKQTKVLDYIKNTHQRYETKKKEFDKLNYIFVSKKLWKMLSKPQSIIGYEVIVEDKLGDLTFFFDASRWAKIPEVVYDVVLEPLIYNAITVNRITAPLDNNVNYQLKLGAKLPMGELSFMLAFIIKEMDKSGHCSKEDMLKLINTHLG